MTGAGALFHDRASQPSFDLTLCSAAHQTRVFSSQDPRQRAEEGRNDALDGRQSATGAVMTHLMIGNAPPAPL